MIPVGLLQQQQSVGNGFIIQNADADKRNKNHLIFLAKGEVEAIIKQMHE